MKTDSPRVSLVLLTHNSERYVRASARSALDQQFGEPLEILISDDCSTDRTVSLVREEIAAYAGPHTVRLLQQSSNSGSKSAHLNRVIPLTRGEILVSFDDDDISRPDRVREIVRAFDADPSVEAVYSAYSLMDPLGNDLGPGRVPHPPQRSASREYFARVDAYAAGATLAIRRSVVGAFGPLPPRLHEDVVLPFRASLLGETVFLPEPLVRARRHGGSLTADMERFTSLEAYRTRIRRGVARAGLHLRSRLQDLAVARRLMPDRDPDFARLGAIAERSWREARLTDRLVSPSFLVRLATLVRLTVRGAYLDDLLLHCGLVFAPRLYLWYKRRSLAFARGPGSGEPADVHAPERIS